MAFYSKENVVIFKTDNAKKWSLKPSQKDAVIHSIQAGKKQSITPPAPERVRKYLLKNCTFFYQ